MAKPNVRTILSNERTFLSWLRTGISLMAFGFVVSKFDLFIHLHILHISDRGPFKEKNLGLAWVGAGIALIAVASIHFHLTRRRIYRGEELPKSTLPLILAIILGILGLLVFIYLLGVT